MIRDSDASYCHAVAKHLTAMAIRDHSTAPCFPWQNGHADVRIGSIRRECLDYIVVFGDAHPRRILAVYTGYYNELRTHPSPDKDSPGRRPIQRYGQLAAIVAALAQLVLSLVVQKYMVRRLTMGSLK